MKKESNGTILTEHGKDENKNVETTWIMQQMKQNMIRTKINKKTEYNDLIIH